MSSLKNHRSILGKRWISAVSNLQDTAQGAPAEDRAAMRFLRSSREMKAWHAYLAIHPLTYTQLQQHLFPLLNALNDAEAAAHALADAAQEAANGGSSIGISGDYDCDGLGATALMVKFLHATGVSQRNIHVHIPNRFDEGYGANTNAAEQMQRRGVRTMITLDNGIHAHAAFARAKDLGITRRIALDHHPNKSGDALPDALVVDPKRADEPYSTYDKWGIADLAGVGVTWQVCRRATEILAARHHFNDQRPMPDARDWLPLVAVSTLADVVNCKSALNTALVYHGLTALRDARDPYLTNLFEVAHVPIPPRMEGESRAEENLHLQTLSDAIRFTIAPIINAPGRMAQSVAWAFLIPPESVLLDTDPWQKVSDANRSLRNALEESARAYQQQHLRAPDSLQRQIERSLKIPDIALDQPAMPEQKQYALMLLSQQLNDRRKLVEATITRKAKKQAIGYLADHPDAPCLVLAGEGWHEGVVGIVAGRIKDEFNLPTFVISTHGEQAKGSARSFDAQANIGELVLREVGRSLYKGGGHPMAAGFSLKTHNIPALRAAAEHYFAAIVPAIHAQQSFTVDRAWDFKTIPSASNRSAVEQMDDFITHEQAALGFFAEGRKQPVVAVTSFRLSQPEQSAKGGHLHLSLHPNTTGFGTGWSIPATAYRAADTRLGELLRHAAMHKNHGEQLVLYGSIQPKHEKDARPGSFTFRIEDAQMMHPHSSNFIELFAKKHDRGRTA